MPNNPSSQQHSFTQTIWRNSLPNHERRRAHSFESPLQQIIHQPPCFQTTMQAVSVSAVLS